MGFYRSEVQSQYQRETLPRPTAWAKESPTGRTSRSPLEDKEEPLDFYGSEVQSVRLWNKPWGAGSMSVVSFPEGHQGLPYIRKVTEYLQLNQGE